MPGSLPNAPLFIGFPRKTAASARALWVCAWFARAWLHCLVLYNYNYLISNLVWLVLSSSHCFPEDFLPETLLLGPLLEATKKNTKINKPSHAKPGIERQNCKYAK